MNTLRWIIVLCSLFITTMAQSQEIEPSFIVYARTYSLFSYQPEPSGRDSALIVQRVRPQFELGMGDTAALQVAWDVLPLVGTIGSQSANFAVRTGNTLRLVDFEGVVVEPDSRDWILQHNLDRLVVSFYTDSFELRLGRQALSHGSARLFPASDIFAPFGPGSIDTEFKKGIDLLRLTIPFSTQEVELYVVANTTTVRDWMLLARWRASFTGMFDVSAMAGMSYRRPTMALDVSGDLWGATWYIDSFWRAALDEDERQGVRVSMGMNYQFSFGLNSSLALHYNHLDLPSSSTNLSIERQIGEVFLQNNFYAGTSLGYSLTPLTNISMAYMQNLTEASGLLTLGFGYDFAQEVTVGLGAIVPVGQRPDEMNSPQSEFGAYPWVGFTDVRLVF